MSAVASLPAAWPMREGGLLEPDAGLAAAVALVLPLALFAAGFGGMNRSLYPAAALLLAFHLYRRRSPWYLGFCVWLFCASPFVRRITDFQAGWDPANPVLVAPYLACGLAAFSFLRYASRSRAPFVTPFVAVMACVGFGTVLAALDGRLVSGLVDALRWSAGPLCAVHLMRECRVQPAIHRAVFNSLLLAGPVMAAYGVAQFLEPAAWDREWMVNVQSLGFDSIGQPVPFEVRVFSVLNSPASLSMFLVMAVLAFLGRSLLVAMPAIAAMMLCLALTQYRAGWGGLGIGLLCLLLVGAPRERLRILVAGLVLFLSAGSLAVVPEVSNTISERVETLTRLSEDRSGQDRLEQYGDFLRNTDGLVLGQGLALSGATRQLDGKEGYVIDGGLMEPVLAFGVFGGAAFLGSMLALVAAAFRARRGAGRNYALYCAGCAACFAQIPFARVLMGENGFLGWLFLGLALSDALRRRAAEER